MLPVASTVQPPIATAQEPIMVCCAGEHVDIVLWVSVFNDRPMLMV